NPIEDARLAQVPIGCRKAPVDLLRPRRCQHGQKRTPVLAHAAVAIHHLVEVARPRLVPLKNQVQAVWLRGTVPMSPDRIKPESDASDRGSWDIRAKAVRAE